MFWIVLVVAVVALGALVLVWMLSGKSQTEDHPQWYVDHIERRNRERSQEKADLEAVPSEWIRAKEATGVEGQVAILAYLDRMQEIQNNLKKDESVSSYERYRFMGPG